MPIPGIDKILYELAMMEGHPDNTTPAMIGGFVFSYFHNGKLIFSKINFLLLFPFSYSFHKLKCQQMTLAKNFLINILSAI
jgi:homoserine kinase